MYGGVGTVVHALGHASTQCTVYVRTGETWGKVNMPPKSRSLKSVTHTHTLSLSLSYRWYV